MAASNDRKRRLKIVPAVAKRGEIVTVKTLAEHEMESGVRHDPDSDVIYPRFIINQLICRYNGRLVFTSDWFSGVSANPYLAFKLRAEESGTIEIEWVDDDNQSTTKSAEITVTDDDLVGEEDEVGTTG
ncbi:MAG: thiosulfate oxidation carrier complex protein SoxZ [Alphaproteobacteria bacterium]|jgi:sulfur-oxidizing protein SoxZ|nr:thiosulfate oxidation carrier complex protein SoxZ [Alphaproteobacteria bacterium]MDP6516368.1 thiosulfate oxidation carrier complex protein SoxZ [Alphaproteobacteria bacterium]